MIPRKDLTSTTALLDKANCQLKGERVVTRTDKDDIKKYINSLTSKTLKQQQSVTFDKDSDISISNEDYNVDTGSYPAPSVSKFLKKKITQGSTAPTSDFIKKADLPDHDDKVKKFDQENSSHYSNFKKSYPYTFNKHHEDERVNKINDTRHLSSISYSDIESESSKHVTGQHATVIQLTSSESQNVAKSRSKFLKQKPQNNKTVASTQEIIARPTVAKDVPQRPLNQIKKPERLTSDEESLAEFIGNLSDTDSVSFQKRIEPKSSSFKSHSSKEDHRGNLVLDIDTLDPINISNDSSNVPQVAPKSQFYSRQQHTYVDIKDTSVNSKNVLSAKSESPFYKQKVSEIEPEKNTKKSILTMSKSLFFKSSEDQKTKKNTSSRAMPSTLVDEVSKSRINSKTKGTNKKSSTGDVFSAFGLQTVEDLLGEDAYHEDTVLNDDIKDQSLHSSARRSPVLKSYSRQQSGTNMSITEQIGSESNFNSGKAPVSDTGHVSSEESSDTFESDNESRHESHTHSSKVAVSHTQVTIKTRTMEVQTDVPKGLHYTWDPNISNPVLGPQYGLSAVDPLPIATHVVSADALEAMTAYSPATIALHNILRDQLHLTTQFLQAQQSLYKHFSGENDSHYNYTTLDDTKQFIQKHRKPRLTFEEALRMVTQESV